MDSVESGQSFTVTRDGHQIAELIPLRKRRTFVPRDEFLGGGPTVMDPVDVDRLRADLDAEVDQGVVDPYAR